LRPLVTLAIVLWVLGWSASSYADIGRGPGGGRYDPTPITAHHRLLPRFIEQIPRDAAVTATAAVHPHVSLRRYVYQFPIGLDTPVSADWALLDVTTATDMAPGDVRTQVEAMLAGEWGVVDGADGFLLLHKGAANKTIPPDFYTFARSSGNAGNTPLTLLDASVDDWPRWRATKLITVWQVGEGYDATLFDPSIEVRTPAGETLYTFSDALPPALVWYPPTEWQPGDLVRVTTLPLYLPHAFGVVAARNSAFTITSPGVGNEQAQVVTAFQRGANGELASLDTTPTDDAPQIGVWLHGEGASSAAPFSARFLLPDGERFIVTAVYGADAIWPGAVMDVRLGWQGEGVDAWPQEVVAFVHLRRNGENASQQDGLPRYFVLHPLSNTGKWADWRQLTVPLDAPLTGETDEWQLVVGLYDPVQGTRLPVIDVGGNPLGDEAVVGTLLWRKPPIPDQSCALIPATCASQVE
jgi:hypothetical protein